MAFPTSPTNGQQANINGITYTYSNTVTAWTVSTSVSNTFVSINVSDNVNSGNVLATGVISATGNVLGSNLVVTGNIVDTGALTIVTGSNGNITLSPDGTGIVAATGAISTTGNISANNATFTSNQTLSYGTANGVVYLNSSKVLTTGSALVFDGSKLDVLRSSTTTTAFDESVIRAINSGAATLNQRVDIAMRFQDGTYNGTGGISMIRESATARSGALSFSSINSSGDATNAMRLDSSGNLGLGVTPSAWSLSGLQALQVKNGSLYGYVNEFGMQANAYYNAGWRYITTAAASQYTQSGGVHGWLNAPSGTAGNTATFTQAMTLDASGNLLVGKTSASLGANGFEGSADGTVSSTLSASTSATSTYNAYSSGVGAFRFYVDMGGTVHATSIAITAISDQRLKENVRDIDTGLDSIMALKPRRFDWKEGKGQDKKDVAGFIAQEFEDVFPECVSTSKAGADGIEYKNINHETLIPTLVKAIQEQQALITQLTARITALETA